MRVSLSALCKLYFIIICASPALAKSEIIEEMTVIAEQLFQDTTIVSSTSTITAAELEHINITTVEDAISYEPSLVVRRRFIGDPNGVIGIRSSNMFQGTRSMVFADGMPLHYHLQTRFSGSPRWSLIAPSEIEEVEIIYGPFSAEYSGNAMGGVVNMKTKTPTKRKFTIEGALFSQDYDALATDETFNGNKFFFSYEDRIGDLSIFTSYNRLKNDSQPQTQIRSTPSTGNTGISVDGAIEGRNEFGDSVIYYGDSGPEEATTDLYKIKLGYDVGNYQLRGSIAYEERTRDESNFNNFLQDNNGDTIWNGTANISGQNFSVSGSNFQHRYQERNSLLVGLGVSGLVGKSTWVFDTFYSHFQILDDEEIRTGRNPADPDFITQNQNFRGRLTEYDDTGWEIFDVKFGTNSLGGNNKQRISLGFHYDSYELNIIADDYNSINGTRDSDETDGDRSTGRADSGGKAGTTAVFAQYGYTLSDRWDIAAGLRYEDWTTKGGYSGGNALKKRSEDGFSPKFSIGFFPKQDISLRYSIARAIRFPIVEELYRNDGVVSTGSSFISDPDLKPEDGIFHNLSLEKTINNGLMRINLFYDIVEDVIFNQSTTTNIGTVTTSLPTDEVTTKGIEFIYQQKQFLGSKFDIRYNISHIDTEITENLLNPSIIGNDFPRMPNWRSNLIISYPVHHKVNLSTSLRYASDSSGRLDNLDTASEVFGAHDGFLFIGMKANWKVTDSAKLSFGIDNIFNEEAYVHHPWPSRTFYMEGKYTFE